VLSWGFFLVQPDKSIGLGERGENLRRGAVRGKLAGALDDHRIQGSS